MYSILLLYYILIFIIIPISIFILLIVALIRTLLIHLNITINHKPIDYTLSNQTITYFEKKLIPDKISIDYLYYDSFTNKYYNANLIKLENKNINSKSLVIIHGVCGGSYSWSYCLPYLVNNFSDIYLLNLPGYGKTDGAKDFLLKQDYNIINKYYANFIKETITNFDIQNPTIVAHSLGCVYAVEYAKMDNNMIYTLILVASPAIHPVMSNMVHYLGIIYFKQFPQNIFRFLKNLGIYVFFHLFDILNMSELRYYDIIKWNTGWADSLLYKYINIDFYRISFKFCQLKDMLSLKIPISFIHGEKDILIPSSNITNLLAILKSQIPYFIIKNANHNPSDTIETAPLFAKAIITLSNNNYNINIIDTLFGEMLNMNYLLKRFKPYYSIALNNNLITNYFSYLHKKMNQLLKKQI
jgi:pimeloyl-ACP methyl ester carboxylesterase